MDDAEFAGLVAGVRRGDAAALRALLDEFEPEVRTLVRVRLPRVLRAQFDSMDFVQAVWQSVFSDWSRHADRFANAGHFRGFLAGVARNKVLEAYRRRTTRKFDLKRQEPLYVRRGGRDEPRPLRAPDPSPSQEAQAGDCWDRLVGGDDPAEARVMALRSEGRTFEEIAAALGISDRAARRIVAAARRRLEGPP